MGRQFIFTLAMTAGLLFTFTPTWAVIDYTSSIGEQFQIDVDANFGLPLNNPFGLNNEWEFKFPEGKVGAAVGGGIPWSGQAGWCQSIDSWQCGESGEYGYFFEEGWSAPSTRITGEGVIGHGPHHYTWTAPANLDEGGITVSGQLNQLFESARQMQLRAEWNGNQKIVGNSIAPLDNSAAFQTVVDYTGLLEGITPGTVVNFYAEPSETGGNGVNTFVQVSLTVDEAVGDPNWTDPTDPGDGWGSLPAYDGYRTDLGWWFEKDMQDNLGLPSSTTLGADSEWGLRFPDGTVGTPQSGLPWSGQAGWCQGPGDGSCEFYNEETGEYTSSGEYAYFSDENWAAPGNQLPEGTQAVIGHGPGHFTWTAPGDFPAGGVNVDGHLQQLFEPERQMQLRAVVNGDEENGTVLGTSTAPPDNTGVFIEAVAYSDSIYNLNPGDTIDFYVEPADPDLVGGNGVNTFVATSIILTQPTGGIGDPSVTGVTGDYNGDGAVDAADYTLWQDNRGTTTALANDPLGGTIGLGQYQQWQANFGQSLGSSSSAAVPEPTTLLLVLGSLAGLLAGRQR